MSERREESGVGSTTAGTLDTGFCQRAPDTNELAAYVERQKVVEMACGVVAFLAKKEELVTVGDYCHDV